MINLQEFARRRQHVMETLGKDSIVIIPAAEECLRTGDTYYQFRQNSDFYYLTGYPEPEAVLVLAPGNKSGECLLFNLPEDKHAEIWVGKRIGQEGACRDYGMDAAFPLSTLSEKMVELFQNYRRIYYPVGKKAKFDQQVIGWLNQLRARVRAGVGVPEEMFNIGQLLHEMRLRKSLDEINVMRKAAEISAQGHVRAMQTCEPGMMEYQLEAELLYEFTRQGSHHVAYGSIVAGGFNACVLHYTDNNARLKEGDLVLVDAGCEYENYASDITRTFPVNGRFTAEQRAVYEIVLKAQLAIIEKVKPKTPWIQLQETAVKILTEGLVDLGLLKGKVENLIADNSYQRYYMHHFGHWLGLDTHDVGTYRVGEKSRLLEAGMVTTVEPGIYIRPSKDIDEKWWNIGIRIEDDVHVTENGYDILSKNVPKKIEDIEALMK